MAPLAQTPAKVIIPKREYLRLKNLDERFGALLAYFEHLTEIKQARREITQKKMLTQEKVFRALGL